jgi:two-component system, chemotaxis family, sensor kinase CheA
VIDDAAELVGVFRDEAEGRLDSMVEAVLALESGAFTPELVDALFRDLHTIKGGAGVVGLDGVAQIAHSLEDLLESVRESNVFPPELAEPLLGAADAMRELLGGNPAPAAPEPVAPPAAEQRSIRVAPEKLDRLLDLVGESILHQRRLEHALGQGQPTDDELDVGERLLGELKDTAVGLRMLPLAAIAAPFPRAVRDAAAAEGKRAELIVEGLETELDRAVLEGLAEPLVHLLRNAVAHGIEESDARARAGKPAVGSVVLRAAQRGGAVEVTVSDDGAGVSAAVAAKARGGSLLDVLCRAGFSTAETVSNLSGRGVGLDAVRRYVESVGGSLDLSSEPGRGTAFTLRLPLALALLEVLLVESNGNVYGIPLASVTEAVTVENQLSLGGRPLLDVRGEALPLAPLFGGSSMSVGVVVNADGISSVIGCDSLLGREEVVVKPLGSLLSGVHGYVGASVLGDGRVALLLDPTALVRRTPGSAARPDEGAPETRAPKVLVVEDSVTVRELQRTILETAGYRAVTARHGREGLERFLADDEIDLVVTDVEMPELDGLELTGAIRSHPERGSTPVVIVTSRADGADRERGLRAGADAYMVKQGFEQEALLETVHRLVGA